MLNFDKIQSFLQSEKLDGWLLADFHARNNVMVEFLNLPQHLTRRSFFYIPAEGGSTALVHNIEKDRFQHLPGIKKYFSTYESLEVLVHELLTGVKKIAMEYSPLGRLPYVGLVDAGTIELVKATGVEIVSSADLVANFQARMNPEQIELHKQAAAEVNRIKDEAFHQIKGYLTAGHAIDERMVVEFIMTRFKEEGMITDFPPVCAVDANISNPHYDPTQMTPARIKKGNLILIDLWAKYDRPQGVYADITWVAYAGDSVPGKYETIFTVAASARDRAVEFIKKRIDSGPVYGYEVDDACRAVITEAGFGQYFFHRTGHSILENVHGPGPNIDNLETEDRRRLLPGHLFSVEPGIYMTGYGVRTEIDVLITGSGPEVTTWPVQQEIIPLLK
jgi:Xaa-Pro aminopeptidase